MQLVLFVCFVVRLEAGKGGKGEGGAGIASFMSILEQFWNFKQSISLKLKKIRALLSLCLWSAMSASEN
jgi:hypothetical protein